MHNASKQRTVAYLNGRGQMFLMPGADNPSYSTASVQMQPLQFACIGNKKDHWDVGLHRRGACGLVGDHVPSLRFDGCATVPENWLLPAILRAHPPATSTDCPAASDGGGRRFPVPSSRGRSAIVLLWSHSPVAPSPGRFCDFSHAPLPAVSIDRWGRYISREQCRGPASNRLPPHPSHLLVIQLRSCR